MKRLDEKGFVELLSEKGIILNKDYPDSVVLSFIDKQELSRFWCIPNETRAIPFFISTILELLNPWQNVYVWKYDGSWSTQMTGRYLDDDIQALFYRGIGIPDDNADVLVFDKSQLTELVALCFNQLIFGWSVGDDLYIIPDNWRFIVKTSHHDVVYVEFPDGDSLSKFVAAMIEHDYALPDEVPDATFKKPTWME